MIPEALLMEAAKPVINTLIKNVITPKIKQFAERCNIAYNELLIPRGEHFEEYLFRTYKKYSIINTLVFKNEQRLLKDLYLPLTISKEDMHSRNKESFKIDKYPQELIQKYDKILITDTAGMGKSTMTKRIFLDVIDNGYGIPIYLEMRRLSEEKTILDEIQEQVNSIAKDFNRQLLLEFIQTGGFVFFLDGYDEISLNDRISVTSDVQDFISKAGNNVFVITSRPEQALASFGDFQVFTINPLAKKEAYELLRKYDNQGGTSKLLIDELKSGQYGMINEFLKNPLLVSLLFAAFDYKQTIPLKKHIFYRQVYDAYFDSHDLSKGDHYIHDKHSNLDIDDFERVLRYVGFKCLKSQKIEFDKDSLLYIIDEAKEFCPDLHFTSSDFLNDILSSVPLFCKDGQYLKWVHKSLQEYFAAQFIYKDSKESQDAILSALYKSDNLDKYMNMLDIYYDIDNWGFKKNILKPLCESYIKHYEANIYTSSIVDKKEIEDRIGYLFMRDVCILRAELSNTLDPFKEIREKTKHFFKGEISAMTHFPGDDVSISTSINPKRKILSILIKRLPFLFRNYTHRRPTDDFSMPFDKIVLISVHSGDSCLDEFIYYNFYMGTAARETHSYFDYMRCTEEISKINKILRDKEKTSNLIEGL